MGYFVKRRNFTNEGIIIPQGPTANRPNTPELSALRYNTDTNSLEYFNGSVYVDVGKAGNVDVTVDNIASDGINDTFTMSVTETDESNVVVFINGLYQAPGLGNAYTVSGFDITFTSIPPAGLPITVVHGTYGTFVPNSNVFDVPNL